MQIRCFNCNKVFAGRKGSHYCSISCKSQGHRQIRNRIAGKRVGIISHPPIVHVYEADTRMNLRPKSEGRLLANCAGCGLPTTQEVVDRLTPVYHMDCVGGNSKVNFVTGDRTYLFPDVYGAKPTATVYGRHLG